MPRPKKAPGTAADPRNGSKYALVLADGTPKFELDEYNDMVPAAQDAWDRYWFDPVSAVVNQSDYMLVYRWITNVDRYFRLVEEADQQPICQGSQGQDVMNPKYSAANNALAAAERIERQLGMGPSNRSKLGIELVAADRVARPQPQPATVVERVNVERVDPREVGRGDPRA